MAGMRARYEQLALRIWSNRKKECQEIGCELIRVLQSVARVGSLEGIFRDLAMTEAKGRPVFWNVLTSSNFKAGGSGYLLTSISRKLEEKLAHIMMKVVPECISYCITWLLEEFGIREGAEEQLMLADWVRYIVVNFQMTKLATPRWYLIGWLLNYTKHQNARANIKLALFFDWLTYKP
eukprot:TRINITY_DN4518_c0_g1_i1.p1 TRINITY_DN4518_c0_g1~~TRINITY_DN4518_c0_g1_i1.p1  ORF type:complete len:179 (-),score=49.93 TRINITY_DN4518_c0_g1_i1:585-1121(-)